MSTASYEYCPVRTVLRSIPADKAVKVSSGKVITGNKICLQSLAALAREDNNGLDGVMAQLESQLGEEAYDKLMAGSNDLHGFGSWFVTGLRKAGYEVMGADKMQFSFRG